LSPICESNSRFAVKSVGAHAKFAQQLIENIDGTLAAPLRTVCLSIPFNSSLETSLLGLAETA
jgi:hypothetical protein